ncbi:MAG: hypothetical protein LLG16_03595 [Euryarchaeota archaeon]|nr:hypothetical protein [Euryarchaeota archaeon]
MLPLMERQEMGKAKKKETLRASLRESLKKDSDSVKNIRSHMKMICDICTKEGVEPETLLFEINIIRTLSEVKLHEKMIASAMSEGHEISPTRKKEVKKEFFKFLDVIELHGQEVFTTIQKKGECPGRDLPAGPEGVPNEMQQYRSTNERLDYIR